MLIFVIEHLKYMKRLLSIQLVMLVCCLKVSAGTYSVDSMPISSINQYVCNPDGILSSGTVEHINDELQQLRDSTHIQVLVVVIEKVADGDCYSFAETMANKVGVGQKKSNNGLLILVSTKDRRVQFVTGEGLEGDLPDAICRRIQEQRMKPYLKDDNWDEGVEAGVEGVRDRLDGVDSFEADDVSGHGDYTIYWIMLGLLGIFLFRGYYASRKDRTCPYCKHQMRESRYENITKDGQRYIRHYYICPFCGRQTQRDDRISRNYGGGFFMGGGYHGGGGFSGGGFGGGSFGGGGAGSGF